MLNTLRKYLCSTSFINIGVMYFIYYVNGQKSRFKLIVLINQQCIRCIMAVCPMAGLELMATDR